ncbi:MAG TPA: hypothetical protein VNV86_17285 [Candidatus Acidoferrum sp.]|nr:hypothetical protein [Candidatus Acidoferrum sp.]
MSILMPLDNQAQRRARPTDIAIARVLLASMPELERASLARYYCGSETASQIEEELHLAPGRLAEIRMELRKRFFATLSTARGLPFP